MLRKCDGRWSCLSSVNDASEISTRHLRKVYRLQFDSCKFDSCRTMCKNNLCCLNGLINEESELSTLDALESPIKSPNLPNCVGLKNYGSTCYLNAFLQIYFHFLELRQSVYQLPSTDNFNDIIEQLQLIFSQMQLSNLRLVDPGGLIEALNLSERDQQDAPEFHSLFMNLLETRFVSIGRTIIKPLFRGDCVYETRCQVCGFCSQRVSSFLEIDLKVSSNSLEECIRHYLAEELLTGENQYACPRCCTKRDGVRCMRITRTPLMLCFQLLRFTFDVRLGRRVKQKTPIHLPDTLDMTDFITSDADSAETDDAGVIKPRRIYRLSGALLHLGRQSTSGHYIAVVRDIQPSVPSDKLSEECWKICNDEQVFTVPTAQFDLAKVNGTAPSALSKASREVLTKVVTPSKVAGSVASAQKESGSITTATDSELPPSVHISSSAYMVFYRLTVDSDLVPLDLVEVPPHLKAFVESSNVAHLENLQTKRSKQAEQKKLIERRHMARSELLQRLFCKTPGLQSIPNSPIEKRRRRDCPIDRGVSDASSSEETLDLRNICFVPTQWLIDWLKEPEKPPPGLALIPDAKSVSALVTGGGVAQNYLLTMCPDADGAVEHTSNPPPISFNLCPHGRVPPDIASQNLRAVSVSGLLDSLHRLHSQLATPKKIVLPLSQQGQVSMCDATPGEISPVVDLPVHTACSVLLTRCQVPDSTLHNLGRKCFSLDRLANQLTTTLAPCRACLEQRVAANLFVTACSSFNKELTRWKKVSSGCVWPLPKSALSLCSNDTSTPLSTTQFYWIGAKSLARWRNKALAYFTALHSPNRTSPPITDLNSDAVCAHGLLAVGGSGREAVPLRCLPSSLWHRLVALFPGYESRIPVFPIRVAAIGGLPDQCSQCTAAMGDLIVRGQREKATLSDLAAILNAAASSSSVSSGLVTNGTGLYARRDLHTLATSSYMYSNQRQSRNSPESSSEVGMIYLVPLDFLNQWRRFIRAPSLATLPADLPSGLAADDTLCEHDHLLMPWHELIQEDIVFPLSSQEWKILHEAYSDGAGRSAVTKPTNACSHDESINENSDDYPPFRLLLRLQSNLPNENDNNYEFQVDIPGDVQSYSRVCPECYPVLQDRRSIYVGARIRIRVVPGPVELGDQTGCPDSLNSNATIPSTPQKSSTNTDTSSSPVMANFDTSCQSGNDASLFDIRSFDTSSSSALRRSTRTRGTRDDYILRVDSTSKLQDIRIQMMRLIGVAPFDQHLALDGVEFTDYSRTLVQLGIQPDALLHLWVDLPAPGISDVERLKKSGQYIPSVAASKTVDPVETGFKGTRLLDAWSPDVAVSTYS